MKLIGHAKTYLLVFNVCCAIMAYNYPRAIYAIFKEPKYDTDRGKWYLKYKWLLLMPCMIVLPICAYYVTYFNKYQLIVLCFLTIMTLFYVFPHKEYFGFRKIPYLKPFVISVCWIGLTALMPILESQYENRHLVLICNELLIVLVTAVLFDVRDRDEDMKTGLKTFSNQWPLVAIKISCYMLILLRHFFLTRTEYQLPEIIFSIVLTLLVYLTHTKRNDFFYLCLVDGSLVLYPLLMLFL